MLVQCSTDASSETPFRYKLTFNSGSDISAAGGSSSTGRASMNFTVVAPRLRSVIHDPTCEALLLLIAPDRSSLRMVHLK